MRKLTASVAPVCLAATLLSCSSTQHGDQPSGARPAAATGRSSPADRPPREPAGVAASRPPREPAAYAYLCDNAKEEGPHEECAQWFVATRDGRTWRLSDAVSGGTVDLSADGRYLAYHRAADDRVVIRDLLTGTIRPIQETVPGVDADRLTYAPEFLDDDRRLHVGINTEYETGDDGPPPPPGFIADVATGRTIWRLPPDARPARLDRNGTRLMTRTDKSFTTTGPSGTTTVALPGPLRAIPARGSVLLPDGQGQAAQVVPRNFPAGGADIRPARLVTMDTGTGKVRHDIRLSLPLPDSAGSCQVRRWLGASEVLLSCGTGKEFEEITFRVDTRTGAHARVAETGPPKPHLFELVRAED